MIISVHHPLILIPTLEYTLSMLSSSSLSARIRRRYPLIANNISVYNSLQNIIIAILQSAIHDEHYGPLTYQWYTNAQPQHMFLTLQWQRIGVDQWLSNPPRARTWRLCRRRRHYNNNRLSPYLLYIHLPCFSSLNLQLVLTHCCYVIIRENPIKHLPRDFSAILADWNIFVEL